MEGDLPTVGIVIFILLLFVDVLFFGFREALGALDEKYLKENDKRTKKLKKMLETPARYVNTLQIGIASMHIFMGAFGVWCFREEIESYLWIAPLFVFVVLTFGVLVPKKLAVKYPQKWAYAFTDTVYIITFVLRPITWIVSTTANLFLRLFGIDGNEDETDVTEEEIISMVNEGHEQGVLLASEAEMITNIFEFGDKEAKDIMTHRNNILALSVDTPLKEAIHFMLSQRNSRYPVFEENIDKIVGILNLKDALRIHYKDERNNCPISKIDGLVREATVIPETRNIDALFKMMQSTKTQMVIVIDEYGQTAGLVAMEDILEEIVGNIQDEYDEDETYIEQKSDDEYIIDGKTPLEELEEQLQISFAEEEFETLNGFLISRMDRIPEEDEQFSVDVYGYNFKILSVENKMISSVLVTKTVEKTEENVVSTVEEQTN